MVRVTSLAPSAQAAMIFDLSLLTNKVCLLVLSYSTTFIFSCWAKIIFWLLGNQNGVSIELKSPISKLVSCLIS